MTGTPGLPLQTLGATGVCVTRIAFGAGPLGGFYGPVAAEAGAAAARRAFELGIRYFDVAPLYGHGRAESVLGQGLRDIPRDGYALSTKVGRYLVPAGGPGQPARMRDEGAPFNVVLDYSRDGTLRALEQSLQRLGTSHVDLVYVHDVDAHSHGSEAAAEEAFAVAMDGALPALLELKRQRVVRAVGVGINQPHWARRWLVEADLDALMLAGRLTLMNREAKPDILDLCEQRGVAYIAAGPFNGGLLARGAASASRFNYRPATPEVMQRYETLAAIARELHVDLKAAAIQYVLRHAGVASLVIGAASVGEVEENVALAATPVPQAFWERCG